MKKLIRLLQALSPRICKGDLVKNSLSHRYVRDVLHEIIDVSHAHGHKLITYNGGQSFYQPHIKKQKWASFIKELHACICKQNVLEVDRVSSLQEICRQRNIEYLYFELQSSKNVEQFQTNMSLINKMIGNGIRSK